MRSLVVYYSRSGNTRNVALKLAAKLGSDIAEIYDKKNRNGLAGLFFCCKDAFKKKTTQISYKEIELNDYDLICVGTPVWADSMAPAVRTFISENNFDGKNIILFCTAAAGGIQKSLSEMKQFFTGSKILKEMGFLSRDINSEDNFRDLFDENITGSFKKKEFDNGKERD